MSAIRRIGPAIVPALLAALVLSFFPAMAADSWETFWALLVVELGALGTVFIWVAAISIFLMFFG